MADINEIAKQFVGFYYSAFDNNAERQSLINLYRDHSMVTWEGVLKQGKGDADASITTHLEELSSKFGKVQHQVTTLDAQPSSPTIPSMVVNVTGLLIVDDSPNPLHFSQVFHLIPEGGSYYVYNDIFRLNLG
ncbi:NTF2-like protein [Athelia psychrophila]|uniref:NTF2-related export protein n=1 Tax=Athelia psychrophila TaxID=1759441 RepID=A0A166M2P0_9AGAM|nr:NTF2-like protein [Fibularhizoctonia sp. CBS 109695]